MTDGEALLSAIIAHSEADDPRLQYADWLQENAGTVVCPRCNGEGAVGLPRRTGTYVIRSGCGACGATGGVSDGRAERAEFIRVQCELAANHPAHCDHKALTGERCRWCDLRRRERKLLCGHACEWLPACVYSRPEIEHHARFAFPVVDYARGFVVRVESSAVGWLERGDDILAREWVPRVTLTTDMEAGETGGWMRLAAGNLTRVTRVPGEDAPGGARAVAKWTLEREWPGVTFELPPVPGYGPSPFREAYPAWAASRANRTG